MDAVVAKTLEFVKARVPFFCLRWVDVPKLQILLNSILTWNYGLINWRVLQVFPNLATKFSRPVLFSGAQMDPLRGSLPDKMEDGQFHKAVERNVIPTILNKEPVVHAIKKRECVPFYIIHNIIISFIVYTTDTEVLSVPAVWMRTVIQRTQWLRVLMVQENMAACWQRGSEHNGGKSRVRPIKITRPFKLRRQPWLKLPFSSPCEAINRESPSVEKILEDSQGRRHPKNAVTS